jgi:hypothetical protein
MLKKIAIALTLVLASAAPVMAETPAIEAAEAKPVYSTTETTIGVLLEDPAAKAILDKHIPGMTDNPSISMAAGMTLKALQGFTGDKITDEMLAAVDAEFKAMQAAK